MELEIGEPQPDNSTFLFPSIKYNLKIYNEWENEIVLTGIGGVFQVMNRTVDDIPTFFLRRKLKSKRWSKNFTIYLRLSDIIINEIEKLRNKGDIQLNIDLSVQYYTTDKNNRIAYITEESVYGRKEISLPKWIKLLENLGYGQRRIFEVPNPKIVKEQPLETGIKLMEQAHLLLKQGQQEAAFNKCRLALDEIYKHLNSGSAATPVKFENDIRNTIDKGSKPAPNPKGGNFPNKSVYINNLRKQIREYSHLSHHGTYKITSEDAELLVYLCWDLVSYLSKQLAIANKQWPKP